MDKIEIKNLQVYAHHGVYEQEQQLGQRFIVSAVLRADLSLAGKSDRIEDTVNYGSVARLITQTLQSQNYKLIERAAQAVAEAVLKSTNQISTVTIRIEKPWAPIGLPLDAAAVEITRGWHEVYVALGSNMGDKKGYLDMAVERLRQQDEMRVEAVSDWITTKAWGYTEQDDFLNGAIKLKTTLSPLEMLDRLQAIEQLAERKRELHWGPRTLDLDLLLYDDELICTDRLNIPHPFMEERLFVLRPMAQIAPWLRHPVSKKTMKELCDELSDKAC